MITSITTGNTEIKVNSEVHELIGSAALFTTPFEYYKNVCEKLIPQGFTVNYFQLSPENIDPIYIVVSVCKVKEDGQIIIEKDIVGTAEFKIYKS